MLMHMDRLLHPNLGSLLWVCVCFGFGTRECVSAVEQPALVEALLPRPLYAYLGSHIRIKLKASHSPRLLAMKERERAEERKRKNP